MLLVLVACGGSNSAAPTINPMPVPPTPLILTAEINSVEVMPQRLVVSQPFTLTATTVTEADIVLWSTNFDTAFTTSGGDATNEGIDSTTLTITGTTPSLAGTYTVTIGLMVDSNSSGFDPGTTETSVSLIVEAMPTNTPTVSTNSTVTYSIELQNRWSSTNPVNAPMFPSSGHLTRNVSIAHNNSVSFWSAGVMATDGIELLAEIGGTSQLISEVNAAQDAVMDREVGMDLFPTDSQTIGLQFSDTHSLLTTASMLGPSPDWFIGVHDLNLRHESGLWYRNISCPLVGYDAGTEQGTQFRLSNPESNPIQTIHRLSVDEDLINSGFDITESFATLTITIDSSVDANASTDALFVCP